MAIESERVKTDPPGDVDSETPITAATEAHPISDPDSSVQNNSDVAVVGIGASAGALAALRVLLASIPEQSGAAYVVVVHLSPDHDSQLAQLLQPVSRVPVRQVTKPTLLLPDHVYIIPPGYNLITRDRQLELNSPAEDRGKRAPIDCFLRSLAASHDGNSVAVILTGTGTDGILGLREIKEQGGLTIVQDPREAEYEGMPRSAIATGQVDLVLPLAEIIAQIKAFVGTRPQMSADEPEKDERDSYRPGFQEILALVKQRGGADFTRYKESTVERRVKRRMQINQIGELSEYIQLLQDQPDEVDALAEDFHITVTRFFRDRKVFDYLAAQVIPQLFANARRGEPVRVWSVGCATGEEAYSLAMLLLEEADRCAAPVEIQVFASEPHHASINTARQGSYPSEIADDVSPERLSRFFLVRNDRYVVRRELRERLVFAEHDVLADPPFSRIDLILCRNVFIYLQRSLQQEVIETFYYALRPDARLVLGSSEGVYSKDLFIAEELDLSIYRRCNPPDPVLRASHPGANRVPGRFESGLSRGVPNVRDYSALHQQLLTRLTVPSILINAANEVLHSSEGVGRYLVQPGGSPTQNVFKLVREELQKELRRGLYYLREFHEPYLSRPIPIEGDGGAHVVRIHARVAMDWQDDSFALILFDDREQIETEHSENELPVGAEGANSGELELELDLTRARLVTAVEHFDTSQEEMRVSNEELQSANEELRATLEELETSKEELLSINEELQSANQENRGKVSELSQLTDDLQQLMAATNIATLFLDRQLCISRFTPRIADIFNLRQVDTGRPLAQLTHRLNYPEMIEDAVAVLADLAISEREVQDRKGRWYLACLRPYRTRDDHIGGVVLTFVDITRSRRSDEALRLSESRFRTLFTSMDEGFCVVEACDSAAGEVDFRVLELNPAFTAQIGEVYQIGQTIRELAPEHLPFWEGVADRLDGLETPSRFEQQLPGLASWYDIFVFALPVRGGTHLAILVKDISERKAAETALRERARRDAFRIVLADALRQLLDPNEIKRVSCEVLREELEVDNVTYEEVTPEGEILGQRGVADPSDQAFKCFHPWKDHPMLLQRLAQGHPLITRDILTLAALLPEQREACESSGLRGHVSVPVVKEHNLFAILGVHDSRSRDWLESEVELIEEVAERTSSAIERARIEQAVRNREAGLREADRRKDEFLAVLSHELRNPLAPITHSLQIVANAPRDSPRAADALAVIHRQVGLLTGLVNDLLDMTRVANDKINLNLERLELNDLVENTLEDHRALFETNKIKLELSLSPRQIYVNGDSNRLAQSIGNILQNSVKFTDGGGQTQVTVGVDEPAAVAEVRIIDDGLGMSSAVLSRLFQPFAQAETSLARSRGGLGLGLALTKRLLELHGGNITADSGGLNQGTEILIQLPLSDESFAEPPTQASPSAHTLKRRILIIEDNIDAAETLAEVLRLSEHKVAVAYDAPQGLATARDFRPEIILCDIGLPGTDGYALGRAIRANDGLKSVYLIAISGYGMPEDVRRALDAGFDQHFTKPVNIEKLQAVFGNVDHRAS